MHTATSLEERLYRTIAGVLGVDVHQLSETSSPEAIATWDSLNHLNLIMAIEDEFQVRLSPEDTLAMKNVSVILEILGQTSLKHEIEISFADCRPNDLPQLKAFIAKCYGENYVLSVNDAYLRWQYAAPAVAPKGHVNLRLALVRGQIAGCLGFIPVDVTMMGQTLQGAWLANWMVDAERRDLGLGPMLVREVASEFDVTLALGASREARHILSRMGWTDLGALHRYVCVLDREKAALLTEDGHLAWPAEVESIDAPSAAGTSIVVVDRFGPSATQLWERTWGQAETAAGTRRSAKFLNWRYVEHPQFEYRLFEARERDECVGIAVYRIEDVQNVAVRIGRLLELIAGPDIQGLLLDAVLSDARARAVAVLDFFCGTMQLSGVFPRRGFRPGDHSDAARIPLLFQPIERRKKGLALLADLRNIPNAEEIKEWYVTKADSDQDRPN